jgi:hypothetical protein
VRGLAGRLGIGGSDPVAAGPVAGSPQRLGELHPAAELEGRAGGHLVSGGALLAGELVDPLITDHLEPIGGVEQERGVGEGEVIGPLLQRAEQDNGGGRRARMGQVAPGMQVGNLANGLRQGIG